MPEESFDSKRQKSEAEQREVKDLLAQQSMADSTQEIVLWTRLQFVLATIGTGFLLYSLELNRRATKSAELAVSTTVDIGNKELRAYISANPEKLGDISQDEFWNVVPKLIISNNGQTPARIKRHFAIFTSAPKDSDILNELPFYRTNIVNSFATIVPGESVYIPIIPQAEELTEETHRQCVKGVIRNYIIAGEIFYEDIFEKEHFTQFCFRYEFLKGRREAINAGVGVPVFRDIRVYEWIRFGEHNKAD